MRYRIVERRKDNGESYYILQHRLFWIWWDFYINQICELDELNTSIHSFPFSFKNAEQAKATLERIQRAYNYKGITIYPTIEENMFYSLYRAKKHEKYNWYKTLICGSYESCCKQIDELLTSEKNRKYEKVIEYGRTKQ